MYDPDTGTFTDKTITCLLCGQDFTFSAAEQTFFASMHFVDPRRCRPCRSEHRARRDAQQVTS